MNKADLENLDLERLTEETFRLARQLHPMLRGRHPFVIGGALADLVALYIAGHHPSLREELFAEWVETTRRMIEPSARQRFGGKSWPFDV